MDHWHIGRSWQTSQMSWLRRSQDLIALLTAAAQGNAFEVYLRTSTMLSDGDFK